MNNKIFTSVPVNIGLPLNLLLNLYDLESNKLDINPYKLQNVHNDILTFLRRYMNGKKLPKYYLQLESVDIKIGQSQKNTMTNKVVVSVFHKKNIGTKSNPNYDVAVSPIFSYTNTLKEPYISAYMGMTGNEMLQATEKAMLSSVRAVFYDLENNPNLKLYALTDDQWITTDQFDKEIFTEDFKQNILNS